MCIRDSCVCCRAVRTGHACHRQGDRRGGDQEHRPLRGRVGTHLAEGLLYVIGVAFACPVSSDAVVRP
eukprot:3553781-Pyramimonas_sp.AAC.1